MEAIKRIIIHKASLADMDKESLGQVSIQDKPREQDKVNNDVNWQKLWGLKVHGGTKIFI